MKLCNKDFNNTNIAYIASLYTCFADCVNVRVLYYYAVSWDWL